MDSLLIAQVQSGKKLIAINVQVAAGRRCDCCRVLLEAGISDSRDAALLLWKAALTVASGFLP